MLLQETGFFKPFRRCRRVHVGCGGCMRGERKRNVIKRIFFDHAAAVQFRCIKRALLVVKLNHVCTTTVVATFVVGAKAATAAVVIGQRGGRYQFVRVAAKRKVCRAPSKVSKQQQRSQNPNNHANNDASVMFLFSLSSGRGIRVASICGCSGIRCCITSCY